jgi:hypothetical protein
MAKPDKAIPEEIPIEEAPSVIQELVAAQVEETAEQREKRLMRERRKQALIDRKDILERNGLKYEDHTSEDASEIDSQCC